MCIRYKITQGAAPGCLRGGGCKMAKCLGEHYCANPEQGAQREGGGGASSFFFTGQILIAFATLRAVLRSYIFFFPFLSVNGPLTV